MSRVQRHPAGPGCGSLRLLTSTRAATAAVTASLAFVVYLVVQPGGRRATALVDDVLLVAVTALAAWACARAAGRGAGRPWGWLAASVASWGAGQAVWTVYEFTGRSTPFPSLADVGYLVSVPLALIGLLGFRFDAGPKGLRGAVDALIVTGSLVAAGWSPIVTRAARQFRFDAPSILAAAYPALVLVLLATALCVAVRVPPAQRRALALLTSGIVAVALADSLFGAFTALGLYETGQFWDALWMLGFLLVGAGALAATESATESASESAPAGEPARSGLLYTGLASAPHLPPALLFAGAWLEQLGTGRVNPGVVLVGAPVGLLLVARQFLVHLENGRLVGAVQREANRQKEAAAQMLHRARHDALTGAANRSALHEAIDQAPGATLLLVDLNDFTEVNASLGESVGDRLLVEVAARLRAAVGPAGLVARVGGDEFGVLVPGICTPDEAEIVAADLSAALHPGFVIDGVPLHVGATIGVALDIEGGSGAMFRRAGMALQRARAAGADWEVFQGDGDPGTTGALALTAALRAAISGRELEAHYQPKVDLVSGRVVGVEALARWTLPGRGPIPPAEFIPLAEQTGLGVPLTQRILDDSLAQCRRWLGQGIELAMAVNLSPRVLRDRQLIGWVQAALERHGVPGRLLILEITENALADGPRVLEAMAALRRLGVRLAVDDLGAGYSSLAYLKRLPVDELKIDRTFIAHVADDQRDQAIVASIVGVGRALGLTVVAEGVEDQASLDVLSRLGCDLAQGYHCHRPAPGPVLTAWLVANHIGLPASKRPPAPGRGQTLTIAACASQPGT